MLTSNQENFNIPTSDRTVLSEKRTRVSCFIGLLVFFAVLSAFCLFSREQNRSMIPSLSDGEALECEIDPDSGTVRSTGADSSWTLRGVDSKVRLVRINVLQIPETTDVNPSRCCVLYDTGAGMDPENAVWSFLHEGDNYFRIPRSPHVQDLRIDFTDREGDLVQIKEIELNPAAPASRCFTALAAALIAAVLLLLLLPRVFSPAAGRRSAVLYPICASLLDAGAFYCAYTMSFSVSPVVLFLPPFFASAAFFFLCRRLDAESIAKKQGADNTAGRQSAVNIAGRQNADNTGRKQNADSAGIRKKEEKLFILSLLAACFCLYFLWAVITPLNGAPDETMRYRVVQYIFNYHRIPRGDDPLAISPAWGFSYSYYPCLSYVLSALLQAPVSLFTKDAFTLLMAARMVGILSCVLTVWIAWLTACALLPKKPARFAVPVLVGFLPQFAFTAVYVNNNAFAILTGAMSIYCWIRGSRSRWNAGDCILLGISTGLCALSYYVSYGYILLSIVYFIYSARKSGLSGKVVRNRFLFISAITLLVCGWWFIRNAILYKGDILGFSSAHETALLYGDPALVSASNPSPMEAGQSIFYMLFRRPWIRKSILSFIGNFFWMNLPLYKSQYILYLLFFFTGTLGTAAAVLKKFFSRQKAIYSMLFLAFLFPVMISAAFSYISDYQAQGRYLLPGLLPLSVLLACGFSVILPALTGAGRRLCNTLFPSSRKASFHRKNGPAAASSPAPTQKADACTGICFLSAFYMILSLYVFFSPVIPFYC